MPVNEIIQSVDRWAEFWVHNPIAGLLQVLFAVPALALYAVDLHRFHHLSVDGTAPIAATARTVNTLDGLDIAFASLAILTGLTYALYANFTPVESKELHSKRLGHSPLSALAWIEVAISVSLLGVADTTLALRSSSVNCVQNGGLGACSTRALDDLRAAGALMILAAVSAMLLWIASLHIWLESWKARRAR